MVAVVTTVTEQHRLLRVSLGADVADVAGQLKHDKRHVRTPGQVRSGRVGSGQVRSSQVRSGQVRSGQLKGEETT